MEVHCGRRYVIRVAIILCSIFFVGFIFINKAQLHSLMQQSQYAVSLFTAHNSSSYFLFSKTTITTDTPPPSPAPAFRLLIGIFTIPDKYRHRNLLRLVYGAQPPKMSDIDVKFVFCNLTSDEQRALIALEIMHFDDIIILNCSENLEGGKTYSYFSSLPDIIDSPPRTRPSPYDYVMKADDDTFFHIRRLEESLKNLAREDMYYGFVTPCENMDPTPAHYMSRMGYILSWDLAEHIRSSSYAKTHQVGPEDLLMGDWLRIGHVAKNRYNMKPHMYDFPGTHACAHELIPNTIAIHRLKDQDKWIQALTYFNITKNLKPSKLYHIP